MRQKNNSIKSENNKGKSGRQAEMQRELGGIYKNVARKVKLKEENSDLHCR